MTERQTRQSRKRRRQELVDQVMRDRQVKGAGAELSGPRGGGVPRATGSETRNENQPAGTKKLPLPD